MIMEGAWDILLLIHTMQSLYAPLAFPDKLNLFVDNSEVVRGEGGTKVPKLGIKQQLVLYHDLWDTSQRLQEDLQYKIKWAWVKLYQVQGGGSKWKIETAIHNFCNNKAESARALGNQREVDHFLPDQRYGIIRDGTKIHGGPRETITMASHSSYLMEYICTKNR